jgi:hypothetical protein
MTRPSEDESVQDAETGRRPSWSYPTILVLYVVILLITPTIGTTIGSALFLGLMGFCVWGAVSRIQYEQLQNKYPSLLRSEYFMNMLVLPVVVPLVVFVLLLAIRRLPS